MYKLIDFSSVWEIGFAVNVLFVIFELEPFIEKWFRNLQVLGENWIKMVVTNENDQNFIQRCGWREFSVYYVIWNRRLKNLSALNSILALTLLITAGFKPSLELGIIPIISFLLLIFSTMICSFFVFMYGLPKFKLKCLNAALNTLLEREKKNLSENGNFEAYQPLEEKYKTLVKLIEFTEIYMQSTFYFKGPKYLKKAFKDMELVLNDRNENYKPKG